MCPCVTGTLGLGENQQVHMKLCISNQTKQSRLIRHVNSDACEAKKHLVCKDFGAIEANTTHNTEHSFQKPYMEHRFRQLEMPKMTGALSHVSHTGLALHLSVNGTEPWVTESARLRLPSLRCLTMLNMHH